MPPTCPVISCIRLGIELDRSNVAPLVEAFSHDPSPQARIVIIHFEDVLFMDGAGLGLLYDLLDSCGSGGWVGVVSPRAGIKRLLEISGLSAHEDLRIFDTTDEWDQCRSWLTQIEAA